MYICMSVWVCMTEGMDRKTELALRLFNLGLSSVRLNAKYKSEYRRFAKKLNTPA